MDYRTEAREALARAQQNLSKKDSSGVMYAALELRIALESLIYQRATLYSKELCGKKLSTWQPGKLLKLLLDIDPYADKSGSLSVGLEEEYGKPAPIMHSLGRERVLTLGEIKTYYDRLGSYLHAPTFDQVAAGKGATTEGKEQRCVELAGILDEVLSSPVFNVNFRVFSEISCGKCGKQIVRRLPPDGGTVVATCIECEAQYRVESNPPGGVAWTPLVHRVKCAKADCCQVMELWESEVKVGTNWVCSGCGGKNIISLAVAYEATEG